MPGVYQEFIINRKGPVLAVLVVAASGMLSKI